MQATVSTPLPLIASMLARKPGTCLALQVGVNAPGSAKATTFLPGAKSSSVVMGLGPSGLIIRSVALGTLSPTLAIVVSPRSWQLDLPDPRTEARFLSIRAVSYPFGPLDL